MDAYRPADARPLANRRSCRWWRVVTILLIAAFAQSTIAQDDEDFVPPGLLMTIRDGERTVTRPVDVVAVAVGAGVVDSRLETASDVRWSGTLLVRQPGPHVFHAMSAGGVRVTVGEQSVLECSGGRGFRSGVSVELDAGEHPIEVRLDREQAEALSLQLFWSSPEFTLEPIPADVLFHDIEAGDSRDALMAERGRLLTDRLRCASCHANLQQHVAHAAPDLSRVAVGTTADAISRQVLGHERAASSQMPQFGFNESEADAIAAFLMSVSKPLDEPLPKLPKTNAEDIDTGRRLLLTVGCAACHTGINSAIELDPAMTAGPDLATIRERKSAAWIHQWLSDPASLNADHHMPVFELTDKERAQIAAALVVDESGKLLLFESGAINTTDDVLATGRQLVHQANCAACHRIPTVDAVRVDMSLPVDAARAMGATSCIVAFSETSKAGSGTRQSSECTPVATEVWRLPLQEAKDTQALSKHRRPEYRLNETQRAGISQWLTSVDARVHPPGLDAVGELELHRRGCLACHDRNISRGISVHAASIERLRDDLRGQSQALIPPSLTAVGDKLTDKALIESIAGEQRRRMTWLTVRMPKFRMDDTTKNAIAHHLTMQDRIPDEADFARQDVFAHFDPTKELKATPADLVRGNQLAGAGGLNCTSCHSAGGFEPRNVAPGTRGSDLMLMGERLRPRFFQRWMKNPIRVVPGIEMPAIRRPAPSTTEETLPQQFATLWTALADPNFQPPTVLSRYEQFITMKPGDPPRVIRDVFRAEEPPGEKRPNQSSLPPVPRAFAVGFGNGHSVLLNLDDLSLQGWSIGEFARQRTEGKSWFWDLAGRGELLMRQVGVPLVRYDLMSLKDKKGNHAVRDQKRDVELLLWNQNDDSVEIKFRVWFGMTADAPRRSVDSESSAHGAVTAWNDPDFPVQSADLTLTIREASEEERRGLKSKAGELSDGLIFSVKCDGLPPGNQFLLHGWNYSLTETRDWVSQIRPPGRFPRSTVPLATAVLNAGETANWSLLSTRPADIAPAPPVIRAISTADEITSVPGFTGRRLPIDATIMPTAMTWLPDGRLAFTSLRGDVWLAKDTDGDDLPDQLQQFASGLAAPYGIVDGSRGDEMSLIVSHKPEVLRLTDADNDGVAEHFAVIASGWGFTDDYHDWTSGLVRDTDGSLFVGLGSDYSQKNRPADNDRWRGTVLRIAPGGEIEPVAYSFRFPMGLALDSQRRLFVTDNQGVQNTFNEINHVIPGRHYGVPSRHDTAAPAEQETPSLMVPHPWTRSVNAITFLPETFAIPELAGHGIGCEYDTRCLIRFTTQDVDGVMQGACYRFSLPDQPEGGSNFAGPISCGVGPDGAIYIGSLWDSGWQGGQNTGSIERLVPGKELPNGIREIQATPDGFDITFFDPVDRAIATDATHWSIQAATRKWSGTYATPDSDRHTLTPSSINISDDGLSVKLKCGPFKAGYLYDISLKSEDTTFWPSEGHYSMKVVPTK